MIHKPTLLEISIYSKSGRLEFYKKIPFRSLVRQFVDLTYVAWAYTGMSIRDLNNTLRSVAAGAYTRVDSPAGGPSSGMWVGTGTTAVTISDYKMETGIQHGNGPGQLYYQATTVGAVQVVGNQAFFQVSRNFNNNSGGTVTVQEVGLVGVTSTWYFLLARDITGGIDVLNTKTLAAQYTFKVTV